MDWEEAYSKIQAHLQATGYDGAIVKTCIVECYPPIYRAEIVFEGARGVFYGDSWLEVFNHMKAAYQGISPL